jgi:hypothetical protein
LAADLETACRVAGRDRRPSPRVRSNILDRVFRRDAFSVEIISIILAGPSKGPAARSGQAARSAGAMPDTPYQNYGYFLENLKKKL